MKPTKGNSVKDQQKKILIVDDVEIIRDFMKSLLSLYDLDAEFATNGQEAIDIWEKEDFKAILMDLEMPVMGGMEATRIIRQREKDQMRMHTPIFAVSGTSIQNPDSECSKAGMDGFIAKPVTVHNLLDVIIPLTR